jgi:hypothetical protein
MKNNTKINKYINLLIMLVILYILGMLGIVSLIFRSYYQQKALQKVKVEATQ